MELGIPMKSLEVKTLKVTDIKFKKQWKGTNDEVGYYFSIFLQDKDGNNARKEYYSVREQLPTDLFVIGTYQQIRCLKPDPKADLIEPVIDPEEARKEQRLREAREIVSGNSALPRQVSEDSPREYKQKPDNLMAMAMSYAKDLKVVEMQIRTIGSKVTDADIEDVVRWGKMIHAGFGS